MTVLLGDTGRVAHGTLKTTIITLPTVRETPITSVNLPTAEPAPQISYTVLASDLATFSGNMPRNVFHVPLLYACGKIGASATVLSFRILLNGVSQQTGNLVSAGAGLYYTVNFPRYMPVSVGDIITIALWSNQADTSFVYHAFTTVFTRPQLTKPGVILKDVVFGAGTVFPTLTLAPTPIANAVSPQQFYMYPSVNGGTISLSGSAITFPALVQEQNSGYQLGRASYGDVIATVATSTHATNQTYYQRNYLPSTISFREVLR